MIIDETNCYQGNKAMASVLLLYYQIIGGGGISHNDTIYLDPDDFDGFSYLTVVVDKRYSPSINEGLLREGAIIYVLCELNDMISEYPEDYLHQSWTKRIIGEFQAGNMSYIPEVEKLMQLIIDVPEKQLDFYSYDELLLKIYQKYIVGRFKRVIDERPL